VEIAVSSSEEKIESGPESPDGRYRPQSTTDQHPDPPRRYAFETESGDQSHQQVDEKRQDGEAKHNFKIARKPKTANNRQATQQRRRNRSDHNRPIMKSQHAINPIKLFYKSSTCRRKRLYGNCAYYRNPHIAEFFIAGGMNVGEPHPQFSENGP
jgi:hypothetical protein